MAPVAIRDVRKAFGTLEVIHGVSVLIGDGEFVVLVGPSGCGKSTLLRMIAGLEQITAGEISIGERVVNRLPPKDRDIAMVFQNYALYPAHDGEPEHELLAQAARRAGAEIESRVARGGRHSRARPPARALSARSSPAASASAWPWDAPSCAIRRCSCSTSRCRISTPSCGSPCASRSSELHQRLRTTTVYVTHDQIEAMTMADRIVVMHDGMVEQIGAPLELYDHPQNIFVAGFIGSPAMNFLTGTIRANGRLQFESDGGVLLPLAGAPDASDGRKVVYGVRPEHFVIAEDGARAQVQVVEPTGSELQVVAKLGGADLIAVFRERHAFKPGDGDPTAAGAAVRAPVRRHDRTTPEQMTTQGHTRQIKAQRRKRP